MIDMKAQAEHGKPSSKQFAEFAEFAANNCHHHAEGSSELPFSPLITLSLRFIIATNMRFAYPGANATAIYRPSGLGSPS
eukprot:scaffold427005_cov28-Prasinocladus_malaysianus.AAC.1